MSSKSRQQLEMWVKTLSVTGKVLDVGGSQLPIKKRVKHDENTIFTILDLSSPHEKNSTVDIVLDLNEEWTSVDMQAHSEYEIYDSAFCLEVSEYWYDPLTALKNINRFLKPEGKLYISFHFVYPVHNPPALDYLRYTRAGAIELLNRAGFDVVEITSRTASLAYLTALYGNESMKMARDYPYHDEVGVLIEAKKK